MGRLHADSRVRTPAAAPSRRTCRPPPCVCRAGVAASVNCALVACGGTLTSVPAASPNPHDVHLYLTSVYMPRDVASLLISPMAPNRPLSMTGTRSRCSRRRLPSRNRAAYRLARLPRLRAFFARYYPSSTHVRIGAHPSLYYANMCHLWRVVRFSLHPDMRDTPHD